MKEYVVSSFQVKINYDRTISTKMRRKDIHSLILRILFHISISEHHTCDFDLHINYDHFLHQLSLWYVLFIRSLYLMVKQIFQKEMLTLKVPKYCNYFYIAVQYTF